jgi:hypothetical protein
VKSSVLVFVWLTLVASGVAWAGDVFERKAGLWKITMQGLAGASTHTADLCLAGDTDALIARHEAETMRALCSKREHHKVGSAYVTDSECKIGSRATVSHTVITPDGDGAYRMVVTSKVPQAPGTPDQIMTQEGHWAGACPADMKPGDQVVHTGPQNGTGMKVNVLTSAAGR